MDKGINERIEEIRDRIGDLNARLKEQIDSMIDICGTVKALAEQVREAVGQDPPAPPPPPHPRWEPRVDDIYYKVIDTGLFTSQIWSKSSFDYERYDIGNVFKSSKEADFAAERLKVLAEMQEWAGDIWDDFAIEYDRESKDIVIFTCTYSPYLCGEMRFSTENDARNCINAVGEDRIKKYYFMVSEDEADDDRRT